VVTTPDPCTPHGITNLIADSVRRDVEHAQRRVARERDDAGEHVLAHRPLAVALKMERAPTL
jgi:hypothetical protein